ncbi:helix-turn-helix domain-containing protein [Mycolicibacterium canariasense]|nr:TetR/AcrR family transcriptional regulator [Mycolicibacterium canariasense]
MVATAAGISGPGLYRHFQNKQALLIAVVEEGLQALHSVRQGHRGRRTRSPCRAGDDGRIPPEVRDRRSAEDAHIPEERARASRYRSTTDPP